LAQPRLISHDLCGISDAFLTSASMRVYASKNTAMTFLSGRPSRCMRLRSESLRRSSKGTAMSYVDWMYFRMLVWCLAPLAAFSPLAYIAATFLALPATLGGQPSQSDLPLLIGMAGACLSLVMLTVQGIRLWRWRAGKTDDCFVCGCLLGREQSGRWGPYRRCLGCGKNHSIHRQRG
jgi:hypothetical protein